MLARVLLGLAWLAAIAGQDRRRLEAISENRWTLLTLTMFVGWAALTIVWAEDPGEALTAAYQYAVSAVLFLVVLVAVRTRHDLRWILGALLSGAVIAAAVGVVDPPAEASEGRLTSTILDPNVLAASLVAGAALAWGVFALSRSGPARLLAVLAGCACGTSVLFTGSRGGLLAALITLLAAVALAGGRRLRIAAAAILLITTCAVFFAAFAPDELSERLTQPTRGEERIQEGRTTIWQVAWRGFEDKPVTGLGAGNFRVSSKRYVLEPGVLARTDEVIEKPAVVHNAHLEVLTELGLIGALLYAVLVGCSLGSLILAASRFRQTGDETMRTVALSLSLALIAMLAANFFFSDQYGKELWVLLGLGPAMLTLVRASGRSESHLGPQA
jgi:O-antigen ligase